MSRAIGQRVLTEEAEAILALASSLGDTFDTAVSWIQACRGRVICCGIGKSGAIARKTAATLSSTGTPSHFLHAAEAVHGDLGMITADDVMLVYTHSGETDELVRLFPSFRQAGAKSILVTGRPDSSAGRFADLVLDTGVQREACSNNLAPTTSTTVMLALSDALAIAVMDSRGFKSDDFARFHPSGALGKRLLLTVADVMKPFNEMAVASPDDNVLDVMQAITKAGVGAACVVDADRRLVGLISDGDLRRHFMGHPNPREGVARELMTTGPTTLEPTLMAAEALEVFQNLPRKIGEMPVLDGDKVVGLISLKDLLRSGIV